MLLQDEQYIVHWLTQYGPLPQTQIVSLLRHKPPEVAAKIIRGSCSSLRIRWNPWPTIRPLTHPSYSF